MKKGKRHRLDLFFAVRLYKVKIVSRDDCPLTSGYRGGLSHQSVLEAHCKRRHRKIRGNSSHRTSARMLSAAIYTGGKRESHCDSQYFIKG